MDEFLLSLRWLPMIILAALLVIPTGCLAPGEQTVNVSPEATASLADPTSAPVAANPTLTTKIAAATPAVDLPIAPVPGAQAPDFTLTDLNGNEMALGDLRGQAVLVNFWATWWPYCRSERSALQKAYEQYHDQGFVILSVDIGEGREVVQAFAQGQGLTFPILLDENGGVAQGYSVRGVPTSLFINREGVIQARYTGPMNEALIEKHLDEIL